MNVNNSAAVKKQMKGGHSCCVVGCHNTSGNTTGIKFYGFSIKQHNNIQRQQWINAIRRIK